jgi:hypothetical protein
MPDRITLNVNVDVRPYGVVRTTERVYFDVPAEDDRETITAPATTAGCESAPDEVPYRLD